MTATLPTIAADLAAAQARLDVARERLDVVRPGAMQALARRVAADGFTATCAAIDADPDDLFRAFVQALGRREVVPLKVNWFTCVRRCSVRHPIDGRRMSRIAWSPSGEPQDAVCCYCRDDDLAAARREAQAPARRAS